MGPRGLAGACAIALSALAASGCGTSGLPDGSGDTTRGKSLRYPDDIGRLWAELTGEPAHLVDDLVPQPRIADALRLGD